MRFRRPGRGSPAAREPLLSWMGHETEPLPLRRALTLADEHDAAGRPDEAAFLYRHALDADPDRAAARDGLAQVLASRPRRSLARRAAGRLGRPPLQLLSQRPRVWKYRMLSTAAPLGGRAIRHQPVLFLGPGVVVLDGDVQFGWPNSPLFYTGYCHVEAAHEDAVIELGDRTEFNNNLMIKSEGAGIRVGRDGLFGAHIEIFDSNFHDLDPARRVGGDVRKAPVEIGDNVFVGMGVRILKGVTIGADSVIGAGSVVSASIPAGVIAAGNPARPVREL